MKLIIRHAQVIQQYKGMIPDFDGFLQNLPQRGTFRDMYGA